MNCDDITALWERFPGLDPNEPVPEGLVAIHWAQLAQLAAIYRPLAGKLSEATTALVRNLAAAWEQASTSGRLEPEPEPDAEWSAVAEPLAAGMGLGLAVQRQVGWREPAAFCLMGIPSQQGAARQPGAKDGPPPFLRFEFLPGGGRAGIGLVSSSLWPGAGELVRASGGRDFAQTLASYSGPREDVIPHGAAGSALRVAGVLARSGVGLQPTAKVACPVLTSGRLEAVSVAWCQFTQDLAREITGVRTHLEAGLTSVFGGCYPPPRLGPARAADYLDAAFAVLADMIYSGWRDAGAFSAGGDRAGQARRTGLGLLSRGGRGTAAPVVLLEDPAAIWNWLVTQDCAQHTARS